MLIATTYWRMRRPSNKTKIIPLEVMQRPNGIQLQPSNHRFRLVGLFMTKWPTYMNYSTNPSRNYQRLHILWTGQWLTIFLLECGDCINIV